MPNGSGVGVTIAEKAKNRKTATRHQLSSRFALARPTKLSISTISGNSNATPKISIMLVTNEM